MKLLINKKGIGYVSSGVKILIAIVIGALLLGGLYSLTKDTVMPTVNSKVSDIFNYSEPSQLSVDLPQSDEGDYEFLSVSEFRQYNPMTFQIINNGDRFLGFTVDGENSTLSSDGNITESYFEITVYRIVLDPGAHTFRFNFENGYAQTTVIATE